MVNSDLHIELLGENSIDMQDQAIQLNKVIEETLLLKSGNLDELNEKQEQEKA